MSKTATKKKPTVDHDAIIADAFRRGQDERTAWYEKHIREQFVEGPGGTKWLLSQVPEHIRQMETTASQAIRTHFERLVALESRSAPAEEWPKVGGWAMCLDNLSASNIQVGSIYRIKEVTPDFVYLYEQGGGFLRRRFRPATEAEVSDYKAKEEQRTIAKRLEDERTKEMAKPLVKGASVAYAGAEQAVYLEKADEEGRHILATRIRHVWGTSNVPRHEFTVID